MYSDEEDFDIHLFGGNNNDALLEDWMRGKSNVYVSDGYKPAVVESNGKPWSMPGSNLSDYFNFGFTEESWNDFLYHQINKRRQKIAEKEHEDYKKRTKHQNSPDNHYRKKNDSRSKHEESRKTRR